MFIHDAKLFALNNRSIIETAPLQIYSSALIFAPEMSLVRKQFTKQIPSWITGLPKVQQEWNSLLQTLEGRSGVKAVAFSLDGKLVASASEGGKAVRLWDSATGASLQTLEGHLGQVNAVAFSSDGQYLDTNMGQLSIGSYFPSVIPPQSKSMGERGISVNETWVVQGMEKVLWLPSDYRATCAAVRNNVLVMGHASGRDFYPWI